MKFILVRHAETFGNVERKLNGITKSEYTEKGKKQFIKLINALGQREIDQIYSSPIPRALKIAKSLGEKKKIEVNIEESLSEMNFGIFEGKSYDQIKIDYKEEWELWFKDYLNFNIPEGQSLFQFYSKTCKFIDSIKNKDKIILIVSHGGAIHNIITHLLELKIEDRWHFNIALGSITEIEYSNGFGIMTSMINNI